ncbi:hypothetical protein CBR_g48186 [Chara braunii]|uniref:Uncharacterized protein n=1 Tax=Chara braunii TaxID=69332 RepID=A0A388M2B4_CHABU|nr:hypothetical protein CBR_g48186 [Chara braunii]|eukprot:GBG88655.1 hypothetical protein CBR_g48186 [Chara braunii]
MTQGIIIDRPAAATSTAADGATSTAAATAAAAAAAGKTDARTSSSGTGFATSRKDVLLIGLGVTLAGIALKSGLEYAGLDPLRAGNVVQITLVFGLTVVWTLSYVFRVANKEMTYVKQLKEYEDAVIQKRIEEMPEAELETMLAAIEEEKQRLQR